MGMWRYQILTLWLYYQNNHHTVLKYRHLPNQTCSEVVSCFFPDTSAPDCVWLDVFVSTFLPHYKTFFPEHQDVLLWLITAQWTYVINQSVTCWADSDSLKYLYLVYTITSLMKNMPPQYVMHHYCLLSLKFSKRIIFLISLFQGRQHSSIINRCFKLWYIDYKGKYGKYMSGRLCRTHRLIVMFAVFYSALC